MTIQKFLHRSVTVCTLRCVLLLFCLVAAEVSCAQQIDILLKGGHVIDPKNKIDSKMDVAISENKIVQVAPDIAAKNAKKSNRCHRAVCNARTNRYACTCFYGKRS